jgi:hypothetical protein
VIFHRRFVLMAVLLLLSSSAFFAAGDRDWFETDCDGATFHFRTLDATSGGQKFVFRLSLGNLHFIPELMGGNWLDAKGKRCSADGKCEEASQARIWLNRTKGYKHISGRYELDLGGQHIQGQFAAKYRKHKPMLICE